MPNSPLFFKNKKILTFVFLGIFVCLGLSCVSNIASAATTTAPTFNAGAFLFQCAGVATLLLVGAYTLGLMAILLAARYAVLVALFILSPLAFVLWVFPPTKSLWTKWWENFIRWAFVGVSASFFIFLAISVLTAAQTGQSASTPTDINTLLVCFIFLMVGYKMTSSAAPMVSNAVMGLAKGATGLAMGAVAGGAKTGAKMFDRNVLGGRGSAAVQGISGGVGRMMENIGLREKGETANRAAGQMKDTRGRIDSMSEEKINNMANGKGFGVTAQDRAAAIQNRIEKGKLGGLGDINQQKQALAFAQSHMNSRGLDSAGLKKDALKQNPNLGTPDELRTAVQNQTPGELAKNLDSKSFSPSVLAAMDDKQITTLASKGAVAKKAAMRNLVHTDAGKNLIRLDSARMSGPEQDVLGKNIAQAQALFK